MFYYALDDYPCERYLKKASREKHFTLYIVFTPKAQYIKAAFSKNICSKGLNLQKIFWIGSPFFQAAMSSLGWKVHFFNFEHISVFTWQDLVRMADFEPDIVIVADKSRPPFVLGMEDFPCFTLFYAVDTHIHSWYPYYAQAFDACMVSLKDHTSLFQHKRLSPQNILWSPAFAKDSDQPRPELSPQWDCLFVGTINEHTTPTRKVFLAALQEKLGNVHCTRGNYAELFPQGRVILNHCEHGDLNFRVFEALGCGSCLVTPHIGHGLTDIFTPDKDLCCYDREDVNQAAQKIRYLLEHDEHRQALQEQGLATINAGHRALHRAQNLTQFLESISPQERQKSIEVRRKNAAHIRNTWLKAIYLLLAEAIPQESLRAAYLQASRGAY